jgi:hypothetical protein
VGTPLNQALAIDDWRTYENSAKSRAAPRRARFRASPSARLWPLLMTELALFGSAARDQLKKSASPARPDDL